jgi:uncharacterized protein YuzE
MIQKKIIFTTESVDGTRMSYVYLKDSLEDSALNESKQQMIISKGNIEGGDTFKGELVIDLDKNGNILGIEILGDIIPDNLKVN